EMDAADILSERRHAYVSAQPAGGYTEMKVLADPSDAMLDLLDGGRRMERGQSERFALRGLDAHHAAHLIVRTAQEKNASVRVLVDGAQTTELTLATSEAWVERVIAIPEDRVKPEV